MPTKADRLYEAMALDAAEVTQLTESLKRRYVDAYMDAIQEQLDRLGERRSARRPQGQELAHLNQLAERDAESIVDTYNRELRNKVDSLDFEKSLETLRVELRQWQAKRDTWKPDQISRATQGSASDYAVTLFMQKNSITQARVIWFARPAIVSNSHKTCIERVRAGAVDWREARGWKRPHPNCRHKKQFLLQGAGDIKGEIWRG